MNGNPDFVAKKTSKYFKAGITWGKITSGTFSVRFSDTGAIFSDAGMKAFPKGSTDILQVAGYLNSRASISFLSILSATLNFEQGNISRIPYVQSLAIL